MRTLHIGTPDNHNKCKVSTCQKVDQYCPSISTLSVVFIFNKPLILF